MKPDLRAVEPIEAHRHSNREKAERALDAAALLLRPAVAERPDDHARQVGRPGPMDVTWGAALAVLGQGYATLAALDDLSDQVNAGPAALPLRGDVS